MGISRDSRHKHRATGGVRAIHQKKRQFELGRPAAMTKLGNRRVRVVRCRGGNLKFRALRLDTGNYSWGSEGVSRKTRILNTVYNASNNELVRTNTLVKNTIVQIDAAPFKQWYEQHFGIELSKKGAAEVDTTGKSNSVVAKLKARRADRYLDPAVEEQFAAGRLLACISSRPGQSGRADGYILEGEELAFYMRKLEKKSKK
ncbi:40S ribosomal protein S8, putative [Perkinsus marinus ATCC 50983]|uniref:40S ribosomal protein S8 n=1 Tax=Perkinsus marinus (strain ATCC 50983 / TXsc) TaxID=423536 RepID=C5KP22_PERM5|nr:40S ribosomal protein S8, putative [Perkinsus marinus ATCC 50983]XP_002782015.1 40S ribosomal protein S8, putative [Perkinsus marinus ATCC 50983]EER03438.1 40S ribosomal protein S8, putative [Perkinsus marinus ATCC 50983]EER13810.1 40S ribosomal protein S8, putative [Perkinsus marinus ATCC 50983]|eukprot:XP_002771622.1 40S ribosomal protein S8, putative [Perkinsus marinus ATCC 50983]